MRKGGNKMATPLQNAICQLQTLIKNTVNNEPVDWDMVINSASFLEQLLTRLDTIKRLESNISTVSSNEAEI